ncbi:ephrin-B3 [Anopheles cruzii]|uniref:ephrin-B3 n=1 Tax=Anopheles cruzii TaxID=68878 RepID=UPI0022EC32A6|nr:ephrin-B3 [Anopheles cruzii]
MKPRHHHHHHHSSSRHTVHSHTMATGADCSRTRATTTTATTKLTTSRRWRRTATTAATVGHSTRSSRSSSGSSSSSSSHHHPQRSDHLTTKRRRYRNLSARLKCCRPPGGGGGGVTSALTVALLVAVQLVALHPTVLHCAKTFYMHWNTTNSIFRIDNTDHIIDVNKGNSQFEYDQVHIICPVYEPGTFDNETEKYIIYNVSKVEYETCRITNHDPRIIAICDKPNKLMFFTITFRPFTPQPGGLEFLPGNDYYFISTSSKDDLHRRIGGRCTTDNMKVVFKVCCGDEHQAHHGHLPSSNGTGTGTGPGEGGPSGGGGPVNNTISIDAFDPNSRLLPPAINASQGNIVQNTVNWPVWGGEGGSAGGSHPVLPHHPPVQRPGAGTAPNGRHNHHYTASPPRTSINSGIGSGNGGGGGYGNSNINNHNNSPPSSAHPAAANKPTKKTKEYDKHPNEVVKNEELTYNNGAGHGVHGGRRPAVALLGAAVAMLLHRWSGVVAGS